VRANSLPSSSCWHYTFAKYASQNARILLAAQTTGGALGSMLAPAKVIVGCSTTGIKGRDGDVLQVTVPYGLTIGLALGMLTQAWTTN
jgi:lactate permease